MKRKRPIRKRSERGKALSYLDSLMREIVLDRDGRRCVRCGGTNVLQCAHIKSKGHYERIRYELLNLLTLCRKCHIYGAHRDPHEFVEWLDSKYPGRNDTLNVLAATAAKLDLKELRIGLELEVAELRAKA